jgi:protein involved in polysaccharide export with SLBB domain
MAHFRSRILLTCLAAGVAGVLPSRSVTAQQLSQYQIEQLRQNPDLVRQQIQQSGLSPSEIRSRLRAAGYPETLLDSYMPGVASGAAPALGGAELGALQSLGLPFVLAEEVLEVDAGYVSRAAQRPSRVFGVDVFRRSTTQFLPLLSGPVPADYRLGPGDMLVLILTGDVELAHSLTVSREGFVVIPQVGQVHVASLTMDQLRDLLYTRLGRVYSGVRRGGAATTRFDVSVVNVRVNQVYVVGEVTQPGAYQLSALGTAMSALYAAGGVTERANLREIVVRRNGEPVATLDLYDYLVAGDTKGDIRLETGDVVFVGVRGPRAELAGGVVRPGIYETKTGEMLADVIGAAGGFVADADLRRLTVHRVLPVAQQGPGLAPRVAIDVPLAPSGDSVDPVIIPPFGLQDGDSVVVHELPPLARQYHVTVYGMVQRPGRFPWREGMTLRELVTLAGGPTVGADLRLAEVARLPRDRRTGDLSDTLRVPLDSSYILDRDAAGRYVGPPGLAFRPPGTASEVPLEPFDRVLILRQPNFDYQRSVTITGEVMVPGTYTLTRKDERLSDLLRRAGGLMPTAYPEGMRFVREFEGAGRVNLDLRTVLASPGSPDDLILQPADSVHIPEYIPTVRVRGAVVAAGSFQWVKGKGADFYLENAGGFAEDADKGRTVVRFANGSGQNRSKFLFWSSWPEPGPGADIFVPAKAPKEATNWLPVLAAVTSILASTASVVIAITK